MGGRALLNDKHAAEVPDRMVGHKTRIRGNTIRAPDIDKRRDIRLPGEKLLCRLKVARGKSQGFQCRRRRRVLVRWFGVARKATAFHLHGLAIVALAAIRVWSGGARSLIVRQFGLHIGSGSTA